MQRNFLALILTAASFTTKAQGLIPFVSGHISGYQIRENSYASSGVPGLSVGAVADLRLSSLFYVQPGLQYAMIGGRITTLVPPPRYQFRVHSLQLPIMLVLKTGEEDKERFFAGVGFYVAANIGGHLSSQRPVVVNSSGQTTTLDSKEDLALGGSYINYINTVQRFDVGLSLGAGYHMAVGPELYLFFQKGSVDMLSKSYFSKSKTYQLGVSVRYAFKLQKHII